MSVRVSKVIKVRVWVRDRLGSGYRVRVSNDEHTLDGLYCLAKFGWNFDCYICSISIAAYEYT